MHNRLSSPISRFIVIVSLSAIFLYVAFRSLAWSKVLLAFQQFDRTWLVPVITLILVSDLLHILRWQRLLKQTAPLPLWALFEAVILGRFTDLILPLNIGSLVRAYRLSQRFRLSLATVIGSLVMEGIIGSLVFWLFSLIVVILVPLPPAFNIIHQQVSWSLTVLTLVITLLSLLLLIYQRYLSGLKGPFRLLDHLLTTIWNNRLETYWHQFQQGLLINRCKQDIGLILLYSVGIRLTFGLTTLMVARGFGIKLPYLTYLFMDILISVAHIVGGQILGIMGTLEAALTYGLYLYEIPKETGLSIALILNAAFILPSAILGLFFFARSGLTWRELTQLRRQSAPDLSR